MDRPLSDSTIGDFLDNVERRAKGEGRTEYVFDVGGTEILPASGEPADSLPDRTETLIVKRLASRDLYDAI